MNRNKDHPANAMVCEAYRKKLEWISKTMKTTNMRSTNKTGGTSGIKLSDEKAFPRLVKSNREY